MCHTCGTACAVYCRLVLHYTALTSCTVLPWCPAVEIVLESDLVDSCKPGDRVAIVGIFRPLASANGGTTSGAYRYACCRICILAMNLHVDFFYHFQL